MRDGSPDDEPPGGIGGGCGGLRIRSAALTLMALIVRHGVVDPDACIVPLIAASADDDEGITDAAHAQLLMLTERLGGPRMETRAVDGAVESYRFQAAAFGEASVRAVVSGVRLPQPLLGRFYSECLAPGSSNPTPRRVAFLRALLGRAIPDTIEGGAADADAPAAGEGGGAGGAVGAPLDAPAARERRKSRAAELALLGAGDAAGAPAVPTVDLALARYLVCTVAFLPYAREEEPLAAIFGINRLLALHADELLGRLAPFLPTLRPPPPRRPQGGAAAADDEEARGYEDEDAVPPAQPIPARGSRAYALLCAHAGYAWTLIYLMQVRSKMGRGRSGLLVCHAPPAAAAAGQGLPPRRLRHQGVARLRVRPPCARSTPSPHLPAGDAGPGPLRRGARARGRAAGA